MSSARPREYPWIARRPTAGHDRWHSHVVARHAMTLEWIQEFKRPTSEFSLPRGISADLGNDLWMLDGLTAESLGTLMDDTKPDDVLGRLEQSVEAVQVWTLRDILAKTPENEKDRAWNQLQQASWRAGREVATRRWEGLSEASRRDLRELFILLQDTPIAGREAHSQLLLRRATFSELQAIRRACPHAHPLADIRQAADQLCELENHWLTGFCYAVHPQIRVELRKFGERCGFIAGGADR